MFQIPFTPIKLGKREEREPLSPVDRNIHSQSSMKKGRFLDFTESSTLESMGPPPATPRKNKSPFTSPTARPHRQPHTTVSPFKTLVDTVSTTSAISIGNSKLSLSPCGKGTFSNVYEVEDNKDIVVKAFHGENTGFNQKLLETYLENIMNNYESITKAGLPVGLIINLSSLMTDRCIVQQCIPDEIEIGSKDQLEQIKPFFRISIQNQIVMDLQPQNFRVKDGNVYLIDFVEEVKLHKYTPEKVELFNKKAIEMWFDAFIAKGETKDDAIEILVDLTGYSKDLICDIDAIRTHDMEISPFFIKRN